MRDKRRVPTIVLIGGGWSAGKSTTAVRLAYRLKMANVVHTDVLRASLREFVKGREGRHLSLATYETWRSESPIFSARALSTGFLWQCQLILPSIKRCLEEAVDFGKDTVVEGLHLHPKIFSAIARQIRATYVWLTYPSNYYEGKVRSRCSSTYRNRAATRYLEKDRARQILMLNELLLAVARRCHVTILDVTARSPTEVIRDMLIQRNVT